MHCPLFHPFDRLGLTFGYFLHSNKIYQNFIFRAYTWLFVVFVHTGGGSSQHQDDDDDIGEAYQDLHPASPPGSPTLESLVDQIQSG